MPSLDDGVSSAGFSAPASASKRRLAPLTRYWDFLAVLLLMLASLPLAWVSPHTLVAVQHPGAFDDHWVQDAVYKVTHGIYFGRDVAFLYGPLAHWLMAAPPRLAGYSLGSVYSSYRTLLLWCALLFSYLTLRLLIPEQPAWKRFLLLLLLGVYWTSWDGRTAFALCLFALFLRGWYAVREGRLRPLPFAGGAALLTAIAFWYSADTGVYGVAAWMMALAGVAWEGRSQPQKFKLYAAAVAGFAISCVVLVFLINILIAGPLDFHFWKTSLALVSVHRWNEPAPMSEEGALRLLGPMVIGAALFLLRLVVPGDRQTVMVVRTGFLLSAFAFAALAMQSGLVRSDSNHIVFGVFPIVFFSGAILFSFASRGASAIAAVTAIGCSLIFSQPAPIFQVAGIHYRMARMLHPITSCPSGYGEFDRVCYQNGFAETLKTAVGFVHQHSSEHEAVLVFPYQYMFAVAARRDVAGSVEQSFLANGAYLSQFDIAGMKRAAAPVGLYFPDADPSQLASPVLSVPIDDVSNFTRTPDVWFWIFRNYRLDQEISPGIFGLLPDVSRNSKISMQQYPLSVTARIYAVPQASTNIDLGAPQWPVGGADFLRLHLKIHYGPLWKLRKPERLQLEITLANGTRSLRTFVLEPNVDSEVWFYPWNESDLSHYFNADESQWRNSHRPAIIGLRLLITPLDWFSQKPASVAIESADAMRFTLAQ